jgi:hypothetical protein
MRLRLGRTIDTGGPGSGALYHGQSAGALGIPRLWRGSLAWARQTPNRIAVLD